MIIICVIVEVERNQANLMMSSLLSFLEKTKFYDLNIIIIGL